MNERIIKIITPEKRDVGEDISYYSENDKKLILLAGFCLGFICFMLIFFF